MRPVEAPRNAPARAPAGDHHRLVRQPARPAQRAALPARRRQPGPCGRQGATGGGGSGGGSGGAGRVPARARPGGEAHRLIGALGAPRVARLGRRSQRRLAEGTPCASPLDAWPFGEGVAAAGREEGRQGGPAAGTGAAGGQGVALPRGGAAGAPCRVRRHARRGPAAAPYGARDLRVRRNDRAARPGAGTAVRAGPPSGPCGGGDGPRRRRGRDR